jgi:uncharacterized membrane protein YczE
MGRHYSFRCRRFWPALSPRLALDGVRAATFASAAICFLVAFFLVGSASLCNTQAACVIGYLPGSQKMVIIRGFTEFRLASYQDCDALDLDLG